MCLWVLSAPPQWHPQPAPEAQGGRWVHPVVLPGARRAHAPRCRAPAGKGPRHTGCPVGARRPTVNDAGREGRARRSARRAGGPGSFPRTDRSPRVSPSDEPHCSPSPSGAPRTRALHRGRTPPTPSLLPGRPSGSPHPDTLAGSPTPRHPAVEPSPVGQTRWCSNNTFTRGADVLVGVCVHKKSLPFSFLAPPSAPVSGPSSRGPGELGPAAFL